MDEPLSNLDAKLRVEMRGEIRMLQQKMGITTIYVTHDQEEALSISDRIAVMEYGLVRQVGKPWEIYVRPQDTFVAGFIGTTNMIDCELMTDEADNLVAVSGQVSFGLAQSDGLVPGTKLQLVIRPEAIMIHDIDEPIPDGDWSLEGEIVRFEYLGSMIKYEVGFAGDVTLLVISYDAEPDKIKNVGQRVKISYPIERAKVFRKDRPQ
jgi:ABC-type Fe3+/spermidine/putrescine transport system ATPase subunit